jgi:hypothetical protein
MTSKEYILGVVEDLVEDFLWYDRKDDELQKGEIEKAIKNNVVTVDEIVKVFRKKLEESIS